jgi:6-phosphogluconolactonase
VERRERIVVEDATALAQEAARHICELARAALELRGRFCVALAGGTTPEAVHLLLARPPYLDSITWEKVEVFFGDERFVAPDDPQSNLRMARDAAIAGAYFR